jgi:hypothetical protein
MNEECLDIEVVRERKRERVRKRERELPARASRKCGRALSIQSFSHSLSIYDRSTGCAHPLHWSEREGGGRKFNKK